VRVRAVTLDTNCIYDLEAGGSGAQPLHELIQAHENAEIELRVPAIAASEGQRGGVRVPDFGIFKKRLSDCGLSSVTLLRPMMYWDITYWDWGVWVGPELLAQERRIHEILFPAIAFDIDEYYASCGGDRGNHRLYKRWLNAKCDVQAMWCHIHNAGELFVTRDNNFLKRSKMARLEQLGAHSIVRPEGAVAHVMARDGSA
jgi:hypothetical protein